MNGRLSKVWPQVVSTASRYGFPPELIGAMVWVESSANTWAENPEPGFLDRFGDAIRERLVHLGDAVALANFDKSGIPWATSRGLMQVMPLVAFERGLSSPWPAVLADPTTGLEFGCRQLAWLQRRFDDLRTIVAAYNGGAGNPRYEYADKVMAVAGRLEV